MDPSLINSLNNASSDLLKRHYFYLERNSTTNWFIVKKQSTDDQLITSVDCFLDLEVALLCKVLGFVQKLPV